MSRQRVTVYLQVASEETDELPDEDSFRRWVNAAALAQNSALQTGSCVTIRVVDSAESQALNNQFRGIDKPTNVLAFPAGPPASSQVADEPELGDLVMCYPVVAAEAREQGKALEAHFAHMSVHGALHLLGLDHHDAPEAEHMEALEVAALENLGFDNPYREQA